MVTVTMEFKNIPDYGVNAFRESFPTHKDALNYLEGYIDAFPITILSFTLEVS